MEFISQDDKNILLFLVHISCITSKFNQFEYACYKQKLIWIYVHL